MIAQYPDSVARDYLEKTEEALGWLRQHPMRSRHIACCRFGSKY